MKTNAIPFDHKTAVEADGQCPLSKLTASIVAANDNNDGNVVNTSTNSNMMTSLTFKQACIRVLLGVWGVSQVIIIIYNALKRLYPVVMQVYIRKDLSPFEYVCMYVWSIVMIYAEGYKGFYKKFAPMVAERAFTLSASLKDRNIFQAM